ncbi:MAG TPA: PQQ-binding-like beta-propeller repeat protein [Urbifossiella sp.]|nr:PQQ-binding-like beta-propeller repeat protein [Urbifossiella sp.]
MSAGTFDDIPVAERPIRAWPGLAILAAIPLLMFVPGLLVPRTMVHFISFFAAPILGSIAILVWWSIAARGRGLERWLFPLLILIPTAALTATIFAPSPMTVPVYLLPIVTGAGMLGVAITSHSAPETRRITLVSTLIVGWTFVGLLRFDGADGDLLPRFRWCWQPTEEELFLAERPAPSGAAEGAAVAIQPGDWPGFRGPNRDGRQTGESIDADWAANPPQLVWKHRIGPGWGSFAVADGKLFTQEQRGAAEAVVCYAADTGQELWEHRQTTRFEEAMGGAGPRATPTIRDGRVYAQGATGKLLCLDAATGHPHWVADVNADADGVTPQWGFSSSPLVIEGVVVVYAGGPSGKGTAAFAADTGKLAWSAGKAAHSYSSAHPANFGGIRQILMLSDYGLESFNPRDGRLLWEYPLLEKGMNRVVQPAIVGDTDLVFGTGVGGNQGLRRLRIAKKGEAWDVQLVWASRALKPYFNDAVVHDGHVFGFDDSRFCCVELANGREVWKEGEYGHGQVLLLADQGLLLVQAVNGKVLLVKAASEFDELASFPALKGKTWNHPVIAHGMLYVRNGQEAACYRLKKPD